MNQPPLEINSIQLPKNLNSTTNNDSLTQSAIASSSTNTTISNEINTSSILKPSTITNEPTTKEGEVKEDEEEIEEITRPKARLVMGEPLGESSTSGTNGNKDTIIEGEELIENEEILSDLPDEAEDLDMTHLRLRTLRGLNLERFKKVQVCLSLLIYS